MRLVWLWIFNTEESIVNALKIWFDGLPVHSNVYYKSPHSSTMTSEGIRSAIIGENGERDPTSLHQDCLGMTPFIFWLAQLSSVSSYINSRLRCTLKIWLLEMHGSTYHCCMLFGGMHQVKLLSSLWIVINLCTRIMNSVGPSLWSHWVKQMHH